MSTNTKTEKTQKMVNPDMSQWLEEKKRLELEPKWLSKGESCILHMRDIRKEVLKKNGRYGPYDQTVYVFPATLQSGREGFVMFNEESFLDLMTTFERMNQPQDLNHTAPLR